MYKVLIKEQEFDLLKKLKEEVKLNIDVILDNLIEIDDLEILIDYTRELKYNYLLLYAIQEEWVEEVVRLIDEEPAYFGMYEIVEE